MNEYVNAGLSELHDILVDSWSDYFRSTDSVTLVAGTETYALPSDFYRSLDVYYVDGNRRYKLRPFEKTEISGYKLGPGAGGTLTHEYVPQFAQLTTDGATVHVSVPIRWEDFVAVFAAHRLAMRQKDFDAAKMWAQELARLRARMDRHVAPRAANPHKAEDVNNRWGGTVFGYPGAWERMFYRVMGDNLHIVESIEQGA